MWVKAHRGFKSHPLRIKTQQMKSVGFLLSRSNTNSGTHTKRKLCLWFKRGASRGRSLFCLRQMPLKAKCVDPFNASDSRQSHPLRIKTQQMKSVGFLLSRSNANSGTHTKCVFFEAFGLWRVVYFFE